MFQREFWEFINSFAPWLSGLGTLLVVAVSLHLARRDERIRLRVSVKDVYYISTPQAGFLPWMKAIGMEPPSSDVKQFLNIGVVNVGRRTAKISQIGFSFPYRKAGFLLGFDKLSSSIPCDLIDGQTADYFYPQERLGNFAMKINTIIKFPFEARLLQAIIFTSVGKTFKKRIPKSIGDILVREIVALRNAKSSTN